MCATKTADVDATLAQIEHLVQAGADIIRVAVDTKADAQALIEIRQRTKANLSCDLQENYRLAADIAPAVDKIRYNPGHLYHHERTKPWQDKVKFLVDVAGENDCALRVGVNCGSIDPAKREKYPKEDRISPMIDSALEHCELLDKLGFTRYVVSLKNSDPAAVVEANRAFAARRPDVPLAPRRDRGRHAARGRVEDPAGLRAAPCGGHRRHDPRLAHRAGLREGARDPGRPQDPQRHRRRTVRRHAGRRPRRG